MNKDKVIQIKTPHLLLESTNLKLFAHKFLNSYSSSMIILSHTVTSANDYPLSRCYTTGIPHFIMLCRYCVVLVLFYLQMEGLWQSCIELVYWRHVSKSICPLLSLSHFGSSCNISNPTPAKMSDSLKAQIMVSILSQKSIFKLRWHAFLDIMLWDT